jgi:predicted phage terminase large subunit-like protein
MERPWLFARIKEVEASPDGHLDLWAREHYKSTVITFGKSIQDILRSHGENPLEDRECTIGIFSHTKSIATAFLTQIKKELESNKKLQEIFPDILYENPEREAQKWSEDGLIVKRKGNPKEPTVGAYGLVDGQPVSVHFTKLVYDDVVVPASVAGPEMMKKTLAALEMSYSLGAEGGVKRFIGTRYHFNDAYKTVMDRGTAKPRIYPATDDGTMTGKPVLLSQASLDEKRRDQGPYTFSSQMLLNPKADETQGLLREWVKDKHSGVQWKGMNTYLLFDPASAKKKTSDYTAAWAVGLHSDNRVYVLDMMRDRLNLPQRTAKLFEWHRKYDPIETRYERYGKDSDIEHIKEEQKRQNYRFEIREVGGATSKNDRIKRLIPYFEQGRIVLPRTLYYTGYDGKTTDLVHDFIEQEFMGFPVGVHDDMLDALARLLEPDLPLLWPKPKKPSLNRDRGGYGSWTEF